MYEYIKITKTDIVKISHKCFANFLQNIIENFKTMSVIKYWRFAGTIWFQKHGICLIINEFLLVLIIHVHMKKQSHFIKLV